MNVPKHAVFRGSRWGLACRPSLCPTVWREHRLEIVPPREVRLRTQVGFTLVELLVALGILAVLAALLLPALARGKAQTRRTVCVNRFRQWHVALMMYADDNQGWIARESFIPGGTVWNLWAQVRNPLARDVWYNALPPELDEHRASDYAPQAVRQEFYDRRLFYHCPCAAFPPDTQGPVAYFSMAMNSKLILRPDASVKFSAIVTPSATVTFLDNRLAGEPPVHPTQIDEQLGQPSAYATRFVTRHNGRGTLAFADGHVDVRSGRDVVADGYAIWPQTTIVWTTDPSVNPNVAQ